MLCERMRKLPLISSRHNADHSKEWSASFYLAKTIQEGKTIVFSHVRRSLRNNWKTHWMSPIFLVLLLLPRPAYASAPNESHDNMVLIPGGEYEMGSKKSLMEVQMDPMDILNPDRHMLGPEDPAHIVDIDPFYIDIYEISNADYKKYMEATGYEKPEFWDNPEFNDPRQPVVGVNWRDAVNYCVWKNKRLPTEAEWEKASRGKRPVTYPWGDDPPSGKTANFNEEHKKSLPIGSFEAGKSDYGVYNLSGNVAEWVNDYHYALYYLFSSKKNPKGAKSGPYKVVRGGHWKSNAEDIRLTYRNASAPSVKKETLGFRCAGDVKTNSEQQK